MVVPFWGKYASDTDYLRTAFRITSSWAKASGP
jgi:hypothetical protein